MALILDKLITMTIEEVEMYPSIQAKIWGNIGQVIIKNHEKNPLYTLKITKFSYSVSPGLSLSFLAQIMMGIDNGLTKVILMFR